MGQSEQLVERAYVRPYTPYVHPRPQVGKPVLQIIMKLIIIIMVLRVMPVLYPLLYSLKPSVHHHLT